MLKPLSANTFIFNQLALNRPNPTIKNPDILEGTLPFL